MSNVCEFLANPQSEDTFNTIDPTADHHKWARKGMDLYYACVVDHSQGGQILCALRAATENMRQLPITAPEAATDATTDATMPQEEKKRKRVPEEQEQQAQSNVPMTDTTRTPASSRPKRRFLIDYVYTAPESRDQGIAGHLVAAVLDLAATHAANCYVLSIEDSCVYWMEKHHFFLVKSPGLNDLLNVFPDTHLLRRRVQDVTATSSTGTNNDNESDRDSDEDEAMARVKKQRRASSDSEDDASSSDGNTTPPESFIRALQNLLDKAPPHSEERKICLQTLALLIQNAAADVSEEGRRRQCRINNPLIRRRVFLVGGDAAMNLLQVCGFALQVNQDGDAILQFHRQNVTTAAAVASSQDGLGSSSLWLDTAVAQLQQEATKC